MVTMTFSIRLSYRSLHLLSQVYSNSLMHWVESRYCIRSLHITREVRAGGNWREQHGQSRTGTSYGPLTDLPDWSYVDGRPAPLTSKRRQKRKAKNTHLNYRIKTLLKEVDLAKGLSQTDEQELENTCNNLDKTPDHDSN